MVTYDMASFREDRSGSCAKMNGKFKFIHTIFRKSDWSGYMEN